MESFRELMAWVDARGDLVRVTREVNPRFELSAVMRQMQKGPNKAIIFSQVTGTKIPVVTNVFGFRHTVSAALGVKEIDLLRTLVEREGKPIPVERVSSGPVQDKIITKFDDMRNEIPMIVFSELDGGPYITAGVLLARHPETGIYNASWNRMQITSGSNLRVRMMPPQHLGRYHAEAEARGQSLPCAVVIGGPPALMLSAASKVPFEVDELEIASAWQCKPIQVVPCKTIPLDVPANAEMVIEGEVLSNVREEEGPFGEFTDSYVPVMRNHVFHVKAITRRHDAIYHAILAGGTEDLNIVGVPIQAEIFKKVAPYVPRIIDIATPGFVFGCVISIQKENEDQPKNALLSALAGYSWIKVAVVVDEDVNPFDLDDVLWAIQTRCTPETGIYLIPRIPSYTREDLREIHRGKVGIDATYPLSMKEKFMRRKFPGEEKIRLEDYIEKEPVKT